MDAFGSTTSASPPVTSPPASDDRSSETLLEPWSVALSDLARQIALLHQLFEQRLVQDAVKEQAFDRLYAELEELRQRRSFEALKPLYLDLLLLYDRIEALRAVVPETSGQDALRSIRDELLEVFYRRGIEVMVPSSRQFDPTMQRAVAVESKADVAPQQVVRVVRTGFSCDNHILRPEDVVIAG